MEQLSAYNFLCAFSESFLGLLYALWQLFDDSNQLHAKFRPSSWVGIYLDITFSLDARQDF